MFFVGLVLALFCEWLMKGMIRPERWLLQAPFDSGASLWHEIWPSLLSLQGVFGTFGSYEPSWSISFEVIYYLVWPLFFYCFARRQDERMAHTLVAAYLISAFLMMAGYVAWRMQGSGGGTILLKLWNVPYGFFTWLFGVALLVFWREEWQKHARRLLVPIGLLCLLACFLLSWNQSSQIFNMLKLPLQLIAFGLLLMVDWRPLVRGKALRWLADLSFPLYVMHGPLQMLLGAVAKTYFPSLSWGVIFVLSIGVPVLIAGSGGVFLERFFLHYRRRFSNRQSEQGT